MTQQRSPSLLGGAMIIAGTAIGAGMLANPTSTADNIRINDPRS